MCYTVDQVFKISILIFKLLNNMSSLQWEDLNKKRTEIFCLFSVL